QAAGGGPRRAREFQPKDVEPAVGGFGSLGSRPAWVRFLDAGCMRVEEAACLHGSCPGRGLHRGLFVVVLVNSFSPSRGAPSRVALPLPHVGCAGGFALGMLTLSIGVPGNRKEWRRAGRNIALEWPACRCEEMGMSKKARKTSNSSKSGSLQWAVGIAVVLVALLIGAQWWSNRQDARTITQAAAYYEQFPTQGTRIGSPDAPVHVEEYFDFQCPHCHTAAEQVVKRLLDGYVAEGKVQFTYRFFPILGPESVQ